jgi:hypothetical protein
MLSLQPVFSQQEVEYIAQEEEAGVLVLKTTTVGSEYPAALTLYRDKALCRRSISNDDRRWIAGFAAQRRGEQNELKRNFYVTAHQMPLQVIRWRRSQAGDAN